MAEQTGGSSAEPSDRPSAVGWGFWLWWVLASLGAAAVVGVRGFRRGRGQPGRRLGRGGGRVRDRGRGAAAPATSRL
jgi:hypothetical protein